MFKNLTFVVLILILSVSSSFAIENRSKQVLESTDFRVDQVLNDVYALVDSEKMNLFDQRNEEMDKELVTLFDTSILRSKLEQFYTMLYYISKYATIEKTSLI